MKQYFEANRRWFGAFLIALLLCVAAALPANADSLAASPVDYQDEPPTAQPLSNETPAVAAPEAITPEYAESTLWGWWRFDTVSSGSPPTTPDSSGYGHTGYLGDDGGNDVPTLDLANDAPSYVSSSASLRFDDDNDWISFHTGPSIGSNDSFTLLAWVKRTETGKGVIFFQGATEDNRGLHLGIDDGDRVRCSFWGNDLDWTWNASVAGTLKNYWHHIACVANYADGSRRIYIDGVQRAVDYPAWYMGSGHLWVGRKLPSTARWDWGGYIDEPRVYTRALTAAEVKMLAQRSGTYSCVVQPVGATGETNGTLYASNDATAVQAGVDTLGAAGGTVRISGTCAGVTNRGGTSQTVLIPTLNSGATMTLEGGWNNTFTTKNRTSYPTVLDANDGGRVVLASGSTGNLTIRDMTLTGGNTSSYTSDEQGGAIGTQIPTSIEHATISSSVARYAGGGIYAGSTLNLYDAVVTENQAGSGNPSTGYMTAYGGGIYALGTLTMNYSTVSNNTARADGTPVGIVSQGGGIFANTQVNINYSHLVDNSAYQGGGLYQVGGGGSIRDTEINGNSALSDFGDQDRGGGIYVGAGGLSLNNAQIGENSSGNSGGGVYVSAGTLTVNEGTISNNTAEWDGGGIYASPTASVVMTHYAIVSGNTSTSSDGGGIYASVVDLSEECQIAGNSAEYGAGIYVGGGSTASSIYNIEVYGNVATGKGGGIYADGASLNLQVTRTLVDDNRAVSGAGIYAAHGSVTVADSTLKGNIASENGGGMSGGGATLNLSASTLNANQAPDGAAIALLSGTLNIVNSTVSGNIGTDRGAVLVSGGSLTMKYATVAKNIAPLGSGLAYVAGSTSVTASIIGVNETVTGTLGADVLVMSGLTLTSGGGNIVGAGDTTGFSATGDLTGQTVADIKLDSLKNNGGPTWTHALLTDSVAKDAVATCDASVTTDQRGKVRPGTPDMPCDSGAFEVQAACDAHVVGSTAVYHTADGYAVQQAIDAAPDGGTVLIGNWCRGIHSGTFLATVAKNLTIEGGYSSDDWTTPDPANTTGLDAAGAGRVLYVDTGKTLTLRNLAITGGTETDNAGGGGIKAAGTLIVEGCEIHDNSADHGAGIFAQAALTLRNSTVSANTARTHGGGIASSAAGTIESAVIAGNHAVRGAGISAKGSLTVVYSLIQGNQATGGSDANGGGIRVWDIASTVSMRSSTVSANHADNQGGGLYVEMEATAANVAYSTFVSNTAGGDGDMIYGDISVTARGTIFDSSGGSGYCTKVTDGGYNIDDGTSCGFSTGTGSKPSTDPRLSALGNYGGPTQTYMPKGDSPAINGGPEYYAEAPGAPETDQRGEPRVSAGRIDAGAVEVVPTCVATIDDGATAFLSEDEDAVQAAANAATGAGVTVKVAGTCRAAANTANTLDINTSATVEGGYALGQWVTSDPTARPTVLDGAGVARGVYVRSGKTVTLRNINITGGKIGAGAGIFNAGILTVEGCNIYGNTASDQSAGAGLRNDGKLELRRSAIYDNVANGTGTWGGGLMNTGTMTVTNSTISRNTAGWGGGLANSGTSTIVATTIVGNRTTRNWDTGANIYQRGGSVKITATILSNPLGGYNCRNGLTSGGYNRISDNTAGYSCLATPDTTDQKGAAIQLESLAPNGGVTMSHMPQSSSTNAILDKIPVDFCDTMLSGNLFDQRGRSRPRKGWETAICDIGAVERGQETWTVCGPPLSKDDPEQAARCQHPTVTSALAAAADDDIVVVSGVVSDHATIDKDITLRGPEPEEVTPGTHMGFLQGGTEKPAAGCSDTGSVVTIATGAEVTIRDLNIRYGCATDGAGIRNLGRLTLLRSTVYDNRASGMGGGIYNAAGGTVVEFTDSTLSGNVALTGGGFYNANAAQELWIRRATFVNNTWEGSGGAGGAIYDTGITRVGNTLFKGDGTPASDCNGALEAGAGPNLIYGLTCAMSPVEDYTLAPVTSDPMFTTLNDNGGATLTFALLPTSPAVDAGYGAGNVYCSGQTDQRGRHRPYDTSNAPPWPAEDLAACDIGAYEYGPRTLIVDSLAETDRTLDVPVYQDLQMALNEALTGDTVAIRAGEYTGNFLAYHNGVIRHADVEVGSLSPEVGHDLRAILQASDRSVAEQKRLGDFGGTVLTVQGYAVTGTTIEPSSDIEVSLSGLTIRYGTGPTGGGIRNRANLWIDRSTIEGNAARNVLAGNGAIIEYGQGAGIYNTGHVTMTHSTVSGNIAESHGGAFYSTGAGTNTAVLDIKTSTIANNSAGPIPQQWVVQVTNSALAPAALPVPNGSPAILWSGDEIRFENQTGQSHTMTVQQPLPAGVKCEPTSVAVPLLGSGLSDPIVCSTDESVTAPQVVHVLDTSYQYLQLTITLTPPANQPSGASVYQQGSSDTFFARSIIYGKGAIGDCGRESAVSHVTSDGTNLLRPDKTSGSTRLSSCFNVAGDILDDPKLGPLQDNNQIDYAAGTVSGFSHTHALLPTSPAIDAYNNASWLAQHVKSINATTPANITIYAGDSVSWSTTADRTVVFGDGEYNERLLPLVAGARPVEMQFTEPSDPLAPDLAVVYRVYNPQTLEQVDWGTITVKGFKPDNDQRGVSLPQRGKSGTYRYDLGAYEFQQWVVGQPVPKPPSASGKRVPDWQVTNATTEEARTYGLWSPADFLAYAVRPSRPNETATVGWYVGQNEADTRTTPQVGTIVWPDAPQLHVADSPVNLSHAAITDGFAASPSDVRAYEGVDPDELSSAIVISNIFHRSLDETQPGDSYTVLPFVKGTQSSAKYLVEVVKSVGWNTPGVRDLRERVDDGYSTTDCVLGRELTYPAFTDAAGVLPGHADPEGRPGYILAGTAYDGVETNGQLPVTQNTVTGLVPPAHVRELRQGPVIPVMAEAPNLDYADQSQTTGGHDLRIAWYRPDGRKIAWPVKSVGYRCRWPVTTDSIVIASELGSEIGGQELLLSTRYTNPTVYHQPKAEVPGYNPNYEHALIAASNLGETSPALYALRTDLFSRDTESAGKSYATLKFQDATQDGRIQHKIYEVLLTRPANPITSFKQISGTVTAATAATAAAEQAQEALMGEMEPLGSLAGGELTFQTSSKSLASDGVTRLSLNALAAQNLHAMTLTLVYSDTLELVRCEANQQRVVERPWDVTVQSEDNVPEGMVVHMRADVAAGTELRYYWDFDLDDGEPGQYDAKVASHVYPTTGTYRVQVTVSNGQFETLAVSPVKVVHVVALGTGDFVPLVADTQAAHCRTLADDPAVPHAHRLVFELLAQNKHGQSGDFKLADITFRPASAPFTGKAYVQVQMPAVMPVPASEATLFGPDYSALSFSITAGNPVYAPVPMRNLLDIQPCEGTQAAEIDGKKPLPFWKDWKGMLWARAADNMDVLYYYPLQAGFAFPDNAFTAAERTQLGLTGGAGDAGKCVPWLHKLTTGTLDDPGSDFEIYPVTYRASWPDLPALLNVGETVYQRAKSGVSAVASQVAVSRIYDDLAKGAWNNDEEQVEVSGAEISTYLTQLIDPMADVKVELPLNINSTPGLPSDITTTRLLYGAGLSIQGNRDDVNLSLPFSLRSRIAFQDNPEDVDGDGEENGVLIFRGYYDGTSPEYIKGDPLLLLNVMADSDKERLLALCPTSSTEDSDSDGTLDCQEYRDAIGELYWKTRNPRQLNLCRNDAGELYMGDPAKHDPEPAVVDSGTLKPEAPSAACPAGYFRDYLTYNEYAATGTPNPDKAFLIGLQDANGDGMPEPFEGLGKGKALTAGNAQGTGYITLAYNNDSSLGGLPVSLQVVKVQCAKNAEGEESPYRGNVLVIKSDNLFDEKLTLRHTGDFGGRPDNFEFEWWIAAVDETAVSPEETPPNYPWQQWTRFEKGMTRYGPEITIEGANVTTLRDNWVLVRYKNDHGCAVCGNLYRYSAFAGDPSAKPSQVLGQLAEGWIKRVVNALNPFDTRVDDFVSSPVNSSVDMIRQAGPRYEGPVAMNADPENINSMGLIEAYQTVLERGKSLSIDSHINDQGANAALLNVTSRIAQLYMLLGNDAYVDALDPIVGFDDSTLGIRASAVFAFANQYRSDVFGPIDEELALLRGRDETLGGVAAGPTYNRLTWNFTNGEGEVAYVLNYNITDVNLDGFINEADANITYPQGHGDAYGQQLTALSFYYQLLKHPDYTWVPRAEPVSVGGAPVVADYYDERRFAAAAAAKARMGAEVVNLTYRKNYAEPDVQPYRDPHVDTSDNCLETEAAAPGCNGRAWGVADWAGRSAEGAYYDWVVANAILPPVDDRYSDVRKIDRTTVEDVATIAEQIDAIQVQLDRADQGANPLGLTADAVLFDLDPALTKTTPGSGEGQEGATHFEQVYDKTVSAVANALKMFVFANQAKDAQRTAQDQQHDFAADIVTEDRSAINELIEIFGYPYDKDIGVNGTYPDGYDGPDIYNYDLIERTDLTDKEQRCTWDQLSTCRAETTTQLVEFPRMPCLGFYVESLASKAWDQNWLTASVCEEESQGPETLAITYTVGIGLDAARGRYLPESWEGAARKGWGEIQQKMWAVYDTRVEYEQAIAAYDNKLEEIAEETERLNDRLETLQYEKKLKETHEGVKIGLKTLLLAGKETKSIADSIADAAGTDTEKLQKNCIPNVFGLANMVPANCPGGVSLFVITRVAKAVSLIADLTNNAMDYSVEVADLVSDLEEWKAESDWELREMGRELAGKIREERELRLAMFLAADNFGGAQLDYDATIQKGYRKLRDLVRMRQRWAGQIMDARYTDMAYRISANDALDKYRQQFDQAQLYTYMAATAYDYETNLKGEDTAAGENLIRRIVGERSLGELRWSTGAWDLDPIVGSGGLADVLGRLRDNFKVLKGQMGFNNPSAQTSRFALRSELFRLLDSSDVEWRQTLQKYYTPNIYANPLVDKLAKKPYGMTGPQPGLVIPFTSSIRQGQNFFGLPLGPGDGAYNPTQFSTKIASVGVWFEGYDTTRLARMPYVYLLPGGDDVLRPRDTDGTLRYWRVTEQLIPLPYPITDSDMQNPRWLPGMDGLQGRMYQLKPYAAFQAFPYTEDLTADQMNTDTRLIGRSVWNTQWVLVIPGANLLADPQLGIARFMEDVEDIYVYFQTYAYAGTAALATGSESSVLGHEPVDLQPEATAENIAPALSAAANPMPQPDAMFYGMVKRDGTPLTSGTLTAVLPRGDTVTTEIAPITGTPYNYAISIPLAYYDSTVTNYATDSARLGEEIRFTVDGVPALLKAADQNYQAYRVDWAGYGYTVTVDVSGPGSYPPGDVNVSGKRDSADALLVLKYDVGLTQGVTTWPPGPATVYLPLCDITQDGACNSTDALRILMCDVGLASCPGAGPAAAVTTLAAAAEQDLAGALPVTFRVDQSVDATSQDVLVHVDASAETLLAAVSLDLRYDPAKFSAASCAENPDGWLDLAACNATFQPGVVRYSGVSAGGAPAASRLLELRLKALDPTVLEQVAQGAPLITLENVTAFDPDGNALRPVTGVDEPKGDPITDGYKVFMPAVFQSAPVAPAATDAPSGDTPEAATRSQTPVETPPAETPAGLDEAPVGDLSRRMSQ